MNILKSKNRLLAEAPLREASIDFEESVRRRLFNVFCISILIPLIIFGIIHVLNKSYVWGLSILLTAIMIMGLLVILRIRRYRKPIYRLSIIIFLFLFTYWTYTGTIKGLGSIWFLGTSPYIFFLLGKREGTVWGILTGIMIAIIFFNPFSLPGVFHYSPDYSVRYLILYFIILIFTYFYEHTREQYRSSLLEEHRSLLLEKEQLSQAKKDLENTNTLLNEEIGIRTQAEHDLLEHKANLEQIVTERTSELREKNIELQASEKRYRLLADNINDVIWMADIDLSITYISPSVQRMLGYTVDEALHLPLDKLCTPESFKQLLELYNETLNAFKENGGAIDLHLTLVCEFIRKDGSILDVEIMTSLIIDSERKLIGIGGITRDISERIRNLKEKEKIQLQLAQSRKMEAVGTLAGGVAHDFNNMLSAIIGYAELAMHEMGPDAPFRANLDRILDAANRSANLTRQLLAFARKQTILPEIMDINEAVESVLKMIRRLIRENIELAWLPGVCPFQIKMDPSQIDQILVNLCVNARDAISGVGRITIETDMVSFDHTCAEHAPGNYVLLAISDTGQGMDKETLDHIFEPFFTTKMPGKGTGMGLATVYGIVKQNQGMINVYSEPLHGTTFKIYLPCHAVEAETPKTEDIADIPHGKGETILIIEDDPVILDMGGEMLQKLGYTVILADTPGEAIRLTRETPDAIHLFITDVIMPEINGRELIERLRDIRPDIKYLYMSGYTSDVIAHQGVLEKGVHYIQKPFSLKSLALKVREVLEHQGDHLA